MADPKRGKGGQAKSGSKRSAAGNPAGMPATGTPADPESHHRRPPRRRTLPPAAPDFIRQPTSRTSPLRRSRARPRGLLVQMRAEELDWFVKWDKVLEWDAPAKWFVGGKLNASYNCVDRHIKGPRRNKAALIWVGEPGDRKTYTYGGISTGR